VHVIRELGGESDLPILVVTSSTDPVLISSLKRQGANDVVPKSAGVEAAFMRGDSLVNGRDTTAGAQAEERMTPRVEAA
jgi:hypothetical protein